MEAGKQPLRQFTRKQKTGLWILAVFNFLIFAGTIFAHIFLDDYIKHQIIKSVYKSSGGQYIIRIENLHTDFWTGNVRMKKVSLIQNKPVFEKLSKTTGVKYPHITITATGASIRHFRWINYLISRDLKVGKIKLRAPELVVEGSDLSQSIRSTDKNLIELLPGIIAGFAGSLRIEELEVDSGRVRYDAFTPKGLLSQKAEDVFININEIEIDTFSTRNLLYSENIEFRMRNYHLTSEDNSNNLSISEIKGSVTDSIFSVADFRLKQSGQTGKKPSTYSIGKVEGTGVDFRSFIYGRQIKMNRINVVKPVLDVITRQDSEDKKKQQLQDAPITLPVFLTDILGSFDIRHISVANGKVTNQIISEGSTVNQRADNINVQISKLKGWTADSLQMASPDEISLSLNNYEVRSDNPEILVKLDRLSASTKTGKLNLDKLNLHFSQTKPDGEKIQIRQSAGNINGEGFDYKTVLNEKKIYFSSIIINQPVSEILSFKKEGLVKSPVSGSLLPASIPDPVKKFIRSFTIGKTEIKEGKVTIGINENGHPVSHQIDKVNIRLTAVSGNTTEPSVTLGDIEVNFEKYLLKVGEQHFSLETGPVSVNSATSSGIIKKVQLIQDHPPGKEKNHYTIRIPEITLHNFDVKRAVYKSEVSVQKTLVNNMNAQFLIHVGKGTRPEYALLMPNEITRKIPVYLRFDSVRFSNAFISETDATLKYQTLIKFENSHALALNITNDPNRMTDQTPAVFAFQTAVMGKGKLDARIEIPLLSEKFRGRYSGRFMGTNGKIFNDVLKVADIQIESGIIDSAGFNINIDNGTASGKVKFIYHDLDLRILGSNGRNSWLKSRIGNFIAKNSNPRDKDEAPEILDVRVKRAEEDSFFFFLWRPLLEGIVKSVAKDTFLPEGFTEK